VSTLGSDLRSAPSSPTVGRGGRLDYLRLFFMSDWMIETMGADGNVTGGVQSWQFHWVPKTASDVERRRFYFVTKVEAQ